MCRLLSSSRFYFILLWYFVSQIDLSWAALNNFGEVIILPPEGEKTTNEQQSCPIKYESLGCYADEAIDPRPLPELILTERDPTHPSSNEHRVDWGNWDEYMIAFICRCARETKEEGYRFFGTQFYGECWSGPEAGETYYRNGEKDYKHCVKQKFHPCQPGDLNCIGTFETNYVYELV